MKTDNAPTVPLWTNLLILEIELSLHYSMGFLNQEIKAFKQLTA